MKQLRHFFALLLCLALACAALPALAETEVVVFAAASMTESLTEIAELYREVAPDVRLVFNFDSSGTLLRQITEGAEADAFISAGQKQMDALDAAAPAESNPDGLDLVEPGTRFDLLANTVVLVAPKGSEAGLSSFADLGADRVRLLALGNADVPVGQYAQDVLEFMGLWQTLNDEGKITFASNVKEVLAQVEAEAVDCGVVYVSDAVTSDGVAVVAAAPEGSHRPVLYPAAVLRNAAHPAEAAAFLAFLQTEPCTAVFERIGFTVPER